MADMDAKGRRVNSPVPKGTVLYSKISKSVADAIRAEYLQLPRITKSRIGLVVKPGEMDKMVDKYGICKAQIYNIIDGKHWL